VRAVLDDVEGAPVSADYTLPEGFGHGYASFFFGAWLKSGTGIRRADGAGARSMVSVLRRNCYVPRAGLLAPKWHWFSCAKPLLPQRLRRVDVWDRSSFTVAGPHRDCTGLPFSALAGTLGMQ
jgi:hypothetical protein